MDMGAVIGAGFRIIRERPGVFAIWAAIYIAMSVGMGLLMIPYFRGIAAAAESGATSTAILSQMGPFFLIYPIMTAVLLVLNNAAYRSVLRPDDSRAAYLRLGMDELRVFVLALLLFILWAVATGTVSLLAIFGFATVFDARQSGTGFAAIAGAIGGFIMLVAFAFIAVRLSLAFPLTILRRKIIVGDAWRLSRGHFWAMLGSFIVVFLIYMIASTVVSLITGGGSAMMTMMVDPERLQQATQQRMSGGFSVMMIISWLVTGIVGAMWVALSAGGLATAAQQLAPDSEEALEAVWA